MRILLLFSLLLPAFFLRAQDTSIVTPNPKEYAVLFQQVAAEYRALCYQAFNIAATECRHGAYVLCIHC